MTSLESDAGARAGFGLIEVLLSAVALSGFALTLATLNMSLTKSLKKIEVSSDSQDLIHLAQMAMEDGDICGKVLGVNPSTGSGSFPFNGVPAGGSVKFNELKLGTATLARVASPAEINRLGAHLSAIEFVNEAPDNITTLLAPGRYLATVRVSSIKTVEPNKPGIERSKFFKITLTTRSGMITGCRKLGSSGEFSPENVDIQLLQFRPGSSRICPDDMIPTGCNADGEQRCSAAIMPYNSVPGYPTTGITRDVMAFQCASDGRRGAFCYLYCAGPRAASSAAVRITDPDGNSVSTLEGDPTIPADCSSIREETGCTSEPTCKWVPSSLQNLCYGLAKLRKCTPTTIPARCAFL